MYYKQKLQILQKSDFIIRMYRLNRKFHFVLWMKRFTRHCREQLSIVEIYLTVSVTLFVAQCDLLLREQLLLLFLKTRYSQGLKCFISLLVSLNRCYKKMNLTMMSFFGTSLLYRQPRSIIITYRQAIGFNAKNAWSWSHIHLTSVTLHVFAMTSNDF